jgi:hypothetical protein
MSAPANPEIKGVKNGVLGSHNTLQRKTICWRLGLAQPCHKASDRGVCNHCKIVHIISPDIG